MQAYGGQQGLPEQEDFVAEADLDEITGSQVAPETEEVSVYLLKIRVQTFTVFFFLWSSFLELGEC